MTTVQQLPQYDLFISQNLDSLKTSILTSNDQYVAVDTETTGLNWREDRAFGVSLAWDDKAIFIRNTDYGVENIGKFLTDLFEVNSKIFIFHNAEFDLHMIRETYGTEPPRRIIDTLRVLHLRNSRPPHGLKEASVEVYGPSAAASEDTIKTYMKQYKLKNYSYVPQEFMDPYACMDTVLTKALAHLYVGEMNRLYPKLLQMEHKLIPLILEMEKNGIKIDLDYMNILHKQYKAEQRSIQDELYSIIGRPLEISSTKQLQGYLYDQLGIKSVIETQTGGRSTSEKALQAIDHPIGTKVAELVLRWRSIEKVDSTYIQPYTKSAHNGRLHPHWNATGTITGRFSSSNPNLQNIPGDPKVRRIFLPDKEFLDFDYAQLELRLVSHAAKQQNMIDAFNGGVDMHGFTAGMIFNCSAEQLNKDQRQVGKRLNFGALYGGGAKKLADECAITIPQARRFLDQFWSSYPLMRSYCDRMQKFAEREGYVHTLFGRRIPVIADESRNATNYIIQGTAGDLVKISLCNTWEYVKSVGGTIRNTVHDEILFDNMEDSVVPDIKEIMEDFSFKIPIAVELKRSKESWGDMIDEH